MDFQARHFFQLQIFTWFNLGFLLDRLTRVAGRFYLHRVKTCALSPEPAVHRPGMEEFTAPGGYFRTGRCLAPPAAAVRLRSLQQNTVRDAAAVSGGARKIPLLCCRRMGATCSGPTKRFSVNRPAGVTYGELLMAEFDPGQMRFYHSVAQVPYNFDTDSIRGTRQDLSSYATHLPGPGQGQVYTSSLCLPTPAPVGRGIPAILTLRASACLPPPAPA